MPIYEFACDDCRQFFEVTKPMSESGTPENCRTCGRLAEKVPSLTNIDKTAAGSWNQQSFNPGLGCWTESTKHAEQIAKSRGLEPIGDEPVEKLHKRAETEKKDIRAKRWAEADRVKLYD